MASISSFKASSSTSNPHSYDVFLSFRGEDTRKNFTSHLYAQLVGNSIHTFRDDKELEKGEDIASGLSKAIEESSIFIIIFSEYYATSEWCLNELVKIIGLEEKKKITVLPVFYHVFPTVVEKQEGSFRDAFLDHAKDADEEKKKMIEKWKKVLTKAAQYSGYDVLDQYEGDIVGKICKEIIKKLDRGLLYVGDTIFGMDVHLKQLEWLIKIELDKVCMIGVYGIGGIGKTTIAKAIYNNILSQFDGCSFLDNVGGKDNDGILELQRKLLKSILKDKSPEFNSTSEGIIKIKERLKGKRVLIVLDDVDDEKQLNNLAGDKDWFGPKSRIIITTKDTHLLEWQRVDAVYEVKELNHGPAFELFNWCAFKEKIPESKDYESLSHHVIEYAKGLPIALKVLGSFLFGKNIREWRSALHKLEKTPNMKVQSVLRVSYDRLACGATKKIFLDIAHFFKGEDKDFVSRILGDDAMIEIKVLCERCLITISENKLYMHDLLQQMGYEIVRQKIYTNLERSSRFWDPNDVIDVLKGNEESEKIEGLFIDVSTTAKMQFRTKVFKRMNKLRLLKVYNWYGNISLPKDFEFPSSNLSYLYWDGYPLESLPRNFDASKLVELNLMYGSIKQLWKTNEILGNLKVINLSYSKNLIELPDFSCMLNLEILILEGCTSLECLPRNFHKLKLLQSLSCDGCSKLNRFPEIGTNMRNLRELSLSKTAVRKVPSSVRHLHGLNDLNLSYCKDLAILPKGICSLSSLKNLRLDWCSKLKDLPEMKADMGNLERLDLSSTAIEQLPSSIGDLKALKHLDLSCCENLVSLPGSISNLSSLETLYLLECSRLQHFPEIRGDMKNLKTLDLQSTTIKELPSSTGRLHALENLYLSGCKYLVDLPESICNLSSLKTLYLPGCSRLRRFPEIKGNMKNLTTLDLESTGVKELSSSIGRLHALEHLHLSGCKDLVDLPESVCNLSSLKTLYLPGCSRLRRFPEIKGNMKNLTTLDLESTGIKELPSSIGRLHALEHLYLSGCKDLENLPESICNLCSLKTLHVRDCSKLHGLKLDLGGLQCLEDLQLSYISCDWGCLSGLRSLRSLHLSCCILKQGLIQRNNFFSKLKRLVVNDCNLMEGGIPSDIRHLIKISIEQNHPLMVEGSSSHWKSGHHGSAEGDTNGNFHNKRNPTGHSPPEEPRHKRFRGIQD